MSVSDWVAVVSLAGAVLGLGARAVVLLTDMRRDIRASFAFSRREARENDEEHKAFDQRLIVHDRLLDVHGKEIDEHGRLISHHGLEIAALKKRSGSHDRIG